MKVEFGQLRKTRPWSILRGYARLTKNSSSIVYILFFFIRTSLSPPPPSHTHQVKVCLYCLRDNLFDALNRHYPRRWIRRGPVSWPPRSPDLNLMTFTYGVPWKMQFTPTLMKHLRAILAKHTECSKRDSYHTWGVRTRTSLVPTSY
jgi:hypothetical protein